jgi:hypothetical protein
MSGRLWQQEGRQAVLPAALAEPQGDEPGARAGAGADPQRALSSGCAKRDCRAQPGAARLGAVLPAGNAADHFIDVDDYVVKRLRACASSARGAACGQARRRRWDREYFESLGLHRLRGTIRYPANLLATGVRVMLRADRPLVSRVREIRMHGLNGGVGSVSPRPFHAGDKSDAVGPTEEIRRSILHGLSSLRITVPRPAKRWCRRRSWRLRVRRSPSCSECWARRRSRTRSSSKPWSTPPKKWSARSPLLPGEDQ